MFKFLAVLFVAVACCSMAHAKPQLLAYSSPFVAAPVATSAVVSREFHGNTSPYIAAAYPYTAGYASPYVASPYVAASPYTAAAYTVL